MKIYVSICKMTGMMGRLHQVHLFRSRGFARGGIDEVILGCLTYQDYAVIWEKNHGIHMKGKMNQPGGQALRG
jgi:hypothetical protein